MAVLTSPSPLQPPCAARSGKRRKPASAATSTVDHRAILALRPPGAELGTVHPHPWGRGASRALRVCRPTDAHPWPVGHD